MYDWFKKGENIGIDFSEIPTFTYAKTQIKRDLDRFISHYHTNPRYVKNDNLLLRLLLSLTSSFKRDNDSFTYHVKDEYIQICNSLGITTPTNYGRVHRGVFYNKATSEVILAHETEFNIEEAYRNWMNLEPVKVLHHSFSDLSLQRCNGNYQSENVLDYAVIAINVPMLGLMWKAWDEFNQGQKIKRRTAHFIAMYVITNMIYSHLDLALLSRIRLRLEEKPCESFIKVHPFYINDSSTLIDSSIVELNEQMSKRNLDWMEVALNTKLITSDSLYELMSWIDYIPNKQLTWAIAAAYLPYWYYFTLVEYNSRSSKFANTFYKSKLKYELRVMRNDKLLDNIVSKDTNLSMSTNFYLGMLQKAV